MERTLDNFLKITPTKRKFSDATKGSKKGGKKSKVDKVIVNTEEVTKENFFPDMETFTNNLGTWKEPLKSYVNSAKMKAIFIFLTAEYKTKVIYPPKDLIFNAFNKTTWDNIKVVIIGQDPYPNPGEAMGLSFSVPRGITIPASLRNIYKCLANDPKLNFQKPNHGDLTKWAEQGVFLLNATLTVEHKKANSHQKVSGWNDFTDNVIKTINDNKKGIVFLLWGQFAIAKKKFIDSSVHHVIETVHPSPLAQKKGDFTASRQFSETNEFLMKEGKEPIDWNL